VLSVGLTPLFTSIDDSRQAPETVSTAPKKPVVTTLVQPTPTAVKAKPDIADDVLKQAAPAGVDAVRHLLPF